MKTNPTPPPSPGMGWESRTGHSKKPDPIPPGEAFRAAIAQVSELREYAAYFIAAKADALKIALRNAGLYLALGVMAIMAGVSFVVVAVVLLLIGAARGVGVALGGREWLGDLIIGTAVLLAVAIVAFFGFKSLIGSSRKQTVDKYESRKDRQRRSFTHDIGQRAAEGSQSGRR